MNRRGLPLSTMATRINNREDNVYDKKMITKVLNMYMDECYKAMLNGERVQISGVGTIIPEVKVKKSFNVPWFNKEGGNPPYTCLRISTNNSIRATMNKLLVENIKNGIMGLAKTPLTKFQLTILRESGYLSEEEEEIDNEEE